MGMMATKRSGRIARGHARHNRAWPAIMAMVFAMGYSIAADAQQVVADGTTQTASGTIDTGVLGPTAGHALYALNGGIIQSFSPLTLITGATDSHAVIATSGGSITVFEGSSVSTTGQDSTGLVASGAGSTVTATDVTVLATNFGSFGVGATDGASITVTGGTVTSVNSALRVADDGIINATNVIATATGGNATGVLADGGTINLTGGTVFAQVGAADVGLSSSRANGAIHADGVTVNANGNGIKVASGSTQTFINGTINGDESAISTTNGATVGVENSTLTAVSDGIIVTGGATTINFTATTLNNGTGAGTAAVRVIPNGATPGTLTFIAQNSILAGMASTASGSTASVTLQGNSRWRLSGDSNLTNLVNDTSRVDLDAGAGLFMALTTVNYQGVGGTIGLHASLGGDGSAADRLIIDGGAATGTTTLSITNTGGLGAQTTDNGILVIDVINSGTTASGSFTLAGGSVQAGGYSYTLHRGSVDASNPNAWYLRSTLAPPLQITSIPTLGPIGLLLLGALLLGAAYRHGRR